MRTRAVVLLVMSIATGVSAEEIRRLPSRVAVLPETEKVGCYWYRQREFCTRYCYWEVNGKRYCREREREAFSQAPVAEVYSVAPPMKLGVGVPSPRER